MITCKKCGKNYDDEMNFCPYCGEKKEVIPETNTGGNSSEFNIYEAKYNLGKALGHFRWALCIYIVTILAWLVTALILIWIGFGIVNFVFFGYWLVYFIVKFIVSFVSQSNYGYAYRYFTSRDRTKGIIIKTVVFAILGFGIGGLGAYLEGVTGRKVAQAAKVLLDGTK